MRKVSCIKFMSKSNVYDAMCAMRAKGWSNQKIADSFNCTLPTVLDYIGYQPRYITQASCRKAYARRTATVVAE